MTTSTTNPGDDTLAAAAEILASPTGPDPLVPGTFPFTVQNGSWGHVGLGDTPVENGKPKYTIGGGGCLLTCLCMVANFLTGSKWTPETLNAELKAAGCFSGPMLILEKAAAHIGLRCLESERSRSTTADRDASIMARAIRIIFGQMRLCILHVDLNHNEPGGDVYGDHFVVAFEYVPATPDFDVGDSVKCADPAPGKPFDLDVQSGTGDSTWIAERTVKDPTTGKTEVVPAKVKHMTVVGVIPISKAA